MSVQVMESTTTLPAEESPLRAGRATIVLLVYFVVQLLAGFAAGIVGVVLVIFRGGNLQGPDLGREVMRIVGAPAMIASLVAGGVAMVLMSFHVVRGRLHDGSSTGAAWRVGPAKNLGKGLGIGLILPFCTGLMAITLFGLPHIEKLGPLAQMAVTPGFAHWAWMFMALALAPLIEEPLFRGVLYAGYRQSFGPAGAAVLTTFLFVLMHVTEMVYYWPAVISITGLALATLWLRLRFAAIGPAIAAHFGYNMIVALAATFQVQ